MEFINVLTNLYSRLKHKIYKKTSEDVSVGGAGERQAARSYSGIRLDHIARYEFASNMVKSGFGVLDIACGTGYGTHYLASNTDCCQVVAVDIDSEAIDYAKKYYSHPKVNFVQEDVYKVDFACDKFDLVVSFETIEHIDEPQKLFEYFRNWMKPAGIGIISTPNQKLLPYDQKKFPFHVRHYSVEDIERILDATGFKLLEVYSQPKRNSKQIVPSEEGLYNIYVIQRLQLN